MLKMVEELQQNCVCGLIASRYSTEHVRAYKVILSKGKIGLEELIESCLLPKQRISEIINEFLKDGILHQEKAAEAKEGIILSINYKEVKEKFLRLIYITLAQIIMNKQKIDKDSP